MDLSAAEKLTLKATKLFALLGSANAGVMPASATMPVPSSTSC